jgi:hypothetical protein
MAFQVLSTLLQAVHNERHKTQSLMIVLHPTIILERMASGKR